MQELAAASLLVDLADLTRALAQAVERAEETAVRLVPPAHVPRTTPARLPEAIEAAVVTDAGVRVTLHRVARELSESSPTVEEPRPPGHDRSDCVAPLGVGRVEGVGERGQHLRWIRVEHGLRKPFRGERDRLVGHTEEVRGCAGRIREVTSTPPPTTDPAEADDAAAHPPPTRLVLVRHAVTAQTGPLLSGRTPGIDLSDKGREQAKALGERLAGLPVAVVYASPIERTTQTAAAVAEHHGLEVQALPGVLEADYGEWTGGALTDLAKTDLWKTVQRAPSRARFPGGESLAEMQSRMVTALEEVVARHPGELVVVVSHADPIKAAIAHYTGVHLDLFQRIVVSPASVTVFELGAHGGAMLKCNDTGSLDELLPPPPKTDEEAIGEEPAPAEVSP